MLKYRLLRKRADDGWRRQLAAGIADGILLYHPAIALPVVALTGGSKFLNWVMNNKYKETDALRTSNAPKEEKIKSADKIDARNTQQETESGQQSFTTGVLPDYSGLGLGMTYSSPNYGTARSVAEGDPVTTDRVKQATETTGKAARVSIGSPISSLTNSTGMVNTIATAAFPAASALMALRSARSAVQAGAPIVPIVGGYLRSRAVDNAGTLIDVGTDALDIKN